MSQELPKRKKESGVTHNRLITIQIPYAIVECF